VSDDEKEEEKEDKGKEEEKVKEGKQYSSQW
jgi:hypothetical protein